MIWHSTPHPTIRATELAADKAERQADRVTHDMVALQRHLDRISLACQAMWELLRDHADITETDLENKILEVDLRDGKLDGKIAAAIVPCPNCGRNTNTKRSYCVMCGAPVARAHQFEG